ncbi:MAG: CDP-alcohol phosphatidyltransferase family protein [Deltaproteobacteria bacterium]|nr:CDP-alcohol phosphatidyltransferase family protein [Deltaproteobacteria bacterium]
MSSSAILTLPNLITLLRIGAIPLFLIFLADERYSEALLVFVLAGVTDSIDGAVARWTNSRTVFGAYIDPLADKLLLASSFLILAFLGFLPRWLAILVISRDVITLCGFAVLYRITGHWIDVRPTLMGKASTFLQLLTVTLTLLILHNPDWEIPYVKPAALMLTGGTITVSGFQYVARALLWLNEHDEKSEDEWKRAEESAPATRDASRRRYSA